MNFRWPPLDIDDPETRMPDHPNENDAIVLRSSKFTTVDAITVIFKNDSWILSTFNGENWEKHGYNVEKTRMDEAIVWKWLKQFRKE